MHKLVVKGVKGPKMRGVLDRNLVHKRYELEKDSKNEDDKKLTEEDSAARVAIDQEKPSSDIAKIAKVFLFELEKVI